jgi:hypothetical protein
VSTIGGAAIAVLPAPAPVPVPVPVAVAAALVCAGKSDRATMRQRVAIAAGIAAGMRVIHEHGFVHFDLKPGNVRGAASVVCVYGRLAPRNYVVSALVFTLF